MADADKGAYGDFWYPDVKAGAQGIKWIEKCVESANNGSVWVDYEQKSTFFPQHLSLLSGNSLKSKEKR